MYQEIIFHQLLECLELRWSPLGQVHMVIEIEYVLGVVHVIPRFKKENRFFVNTFKF